MLAHIPWILGLSALVYLGSSAYIENAYAFIANGAFQNFSPALRVLDGQLPGRDFDSYLGSLMPFLGALSGLVFGETLPGVRVGFFILSILAVLAATAISIRLAGLPWSVAASCGVGLVWILSLHPLPIVDFAPMQQGLLRGLMSPFPREINPDASLRAFRVAWLPIAVGLLWACVDRGVRTGQVSRHLATGAFVLPLGLFWAPDMAVGTGAAGALVLLIAAARFGAGWRGLALVFFGGLAGFLAWGTLLNAGRLDLWLEYVLAMSAQQRWYFRDDLNVSDGTLAAIGARFSAVQIWTAAAGGILGWFGWRSRSPRLLMASCLMLGSLLCWLFLASRGYSKTDAWFWRFSLVGVLSVVLLIFSKWVSVGPLPAIGFATGFLLVGVPAALFATPSRSLGPAGNWMWIEELAGAIPPEDVHSVERARHWRTVLEAAEVPPDRRLLSMYLGVPDIVIGGPFGPRSSMVMHVATPGARSAWIDAIAGGSAQMLTTVNPRMYAFAGGMEIRHDWWLHREIRRYYVPVDSTSQFVFWTRRDSPLQDDGSLVSCSSRRLEDGDWEILVEDSSPPSPRRWFYDVHLRWTFEFAAGRPFGTPASIVIEDRSSAVPWAPLGERRRRYMRPAFSGEALVPVQSSSEAPGLLRLRTASQFAQMPHVSCAAIRLWEDPEETMETAGKPPESFRIIGLRILERTEILRVVWSEDMRYLWPGSVLALPGMEEARVVLVDGPSLVLDKPLSEEARRALSEGTLVAFLREMRRDGGALVEFVSGQYDHRR